ncbi:MAG: tyrosine--tRNA ligase [Patescibacteria group bacterium]
MTIFETLRQRGYVNQVSNSEEVKKLLNKQKTTIYQGFDPSADSLHLGHLAGIMALHHLHKAGHRIIFLLGGGTGRVGDPTGKNKSRQLLTSEKVHRHGEVIKKQVEDMELLDFNKKNVLMLNNNAWLSEFKFLDDFLLDIAKNFSVNEMVKMDTFSRRLNKEKHLSLLEFCYPVLQAWDYLYLYRNYDCRLQIGGQDQWANILQGIDLIRKKENTETQALTIPLLTTGDGKKMGKTEKGAIWLDPEKTIPFDFYQYLQGVEDELVEPMLKMLTFLPLEEIEQTLEDPRKAQKKLAFEVTKIVHGKEKAEKAQLDAEKIFGSKKGKTESVPEFKLAKENMPLDEILTEAGALPSKSEVRRRAEQGALRISEKKITDPKKKIEGSCLIRYGKNSFLKVTT